VSVGNGERVQKKTANITIAVLCATVSMGVCVYTSKEPLCLVFASYPYQSQAPACLEPERQVLERAIERSKAIADNAVRGIWSIQPVGGGVCWPDVQVPLESLWKGTAVKNDTWVFTLHSLFILQDLVIAHQQTREAQYLETGRKIVTSWIECNPKRMAPSMFSWSDHSTANRAVSMCSFLDYYVANTPDRADVSEFEKTVAGTLSEHAKRLALGRNYTFPHNHGIFQDYALIVAASHLAGGETSDGWVRLAMQRLERQVARTFSQDGIHLENSPGYHVTITRLLNRIVEYCARVGLDTPASLRQTLSRAESAMDSFVMPDGDVVPVGDTPRQFRVGSPGRAESHILQVRLVTGGYAVMDGDWWIFMAASHNSWTHKHCDDLTLIVHDGAGMVLSDAGFLNYEPGDPRRDFTLSWFAHNTVTSTTEGPLERSKQSGINAYGSSDQYYFVRGCSFRNNGNVHQRSVLYDEKASIVLMIDRCEAPEAVEWRRVFQLDPRVSVNSEIASERKVVLRRPQGADLELSFGAQDLPRELVLGGSTPLCGWVAEPFRELVPAAAILEHAHGKKVTLPAALSPVGTVTGMKMESDDVCIIESVASHTRIHETPSWVTIERQPVGDRSALLPIPVAQTIALRTIELTRPFGRVERVDPLGGRQRIMVLGLTLAGWVGVILLLRSKMLSRTRCGLYVVLFFALVNALALWAIWSRLAWSFPVEHMF
jgi:hypothetical protein